METIRMHCKSISQIQSGAVEVLIQVWLQSNKK